MGLFLNKSTNSVLSYNFVTWISCSDIYTTSITIFTDNWNFLLIILKLCFAFIIIVHVNKRNKKKRNASSKLRYKLLQLRVNYTNYNYQIEKNVNCEFNGSLPSITNKFLPKQRNKFLSDPKIILIFSKYSRLIKLQKGITAFGSHYSADSSTQSIYYNQRIGFQYRNLVT